jgi:hypothetical protein
VGIENYGQKKEEEKKGKVGLDHTYWDQAWLL